MTPDRKAYWFNKLRRALEETISGIPTPFEQPINPEELLNQIAAEEKQERSCGTCDSIGRLSCVICEDKDHWQPKENKNERKD